MLTPIFQLDVNISGSSSINALELKSKSVDANISGVGELSVDVIEKLDTNISGAGEVKYTGTPRINQRISGSGSISQIQN